VECVNAFMIGGPVDLLKWFATAVCKYPDGIDRWSHALPEVLAAIRELEE
jgi:hypothetical protein